MFTVTTIAEAKKLIGEKLKDYRPETEEVTVTHALGRFLSEDVYSRCDVPDFNRSVVDGYALISGETKGAQESLPAYFKITGEVKMGQPAHMTVFPGCAVYVPTGGALPEGADCAVMIEDTEKMAGDELFVYKRCAPKENVLFKGEDIQTGSLVLKKGTRIKPQDLGVLSAIGYDRVNVYKTLKFTVISTGDEIIPPNQIPQEGEIRDINSYTISGVIEERGFIPHFEVIHDDEALLKKAISDGIDRSDAVVISGGSSVGARDLTYKLLDEIEKDSVFVHGLAIKPGKPTIFARVKGKLVIGLPGQPASALMVFKTFFGQVETVLLGKPEEDFSYIEAALTANVHSTEGRETFQMVKLIKGKKEYQAVPLYGKSGTITLIADATGYFIIPANVEGYVANTMVKVYLL